MASPVMLPAGACDCHIHVFGPLDRYPMASPRSYTPAEAPLADYLRMAADLGIERAVFVQPSVYGTDNSCMLDAMREMGANARGVAVVAPDAPDGTLDDLDRRGIRGIRLNIASGSSASLAQSKEALAAFAARIRRLGWHIQIFADLATIEAFSDSFDGLGVPVVIDHFGLAQAGLGVSQPGFDRLLGLLRSGACWVKASGIYRIAAAPDYAGVGPILDALLDANADRVVWASDWPHTPRHHGRPGENPPVAAFQEVDDARLLGMVAESIADEALLKTVFVDNPAALYGF